MTKKQTFVFAIAACRPHVMRGVQAVAYWLKQAAGILFYVNETRRHIEMVSVGGDGKLWVMTGSPGMEARQSPELSSCFQFDMTPASR
jgi:hypothetical protein